MVNLIFAAIAFVLIHRLISGGPGRAALAGSIGEAAFRTLFALASLLCLSWMIYAYAQVHVQGDGAPGWIARPGAIAALAAIQLLAVMLIVAGVMTANPTSVGQGARVSNPEIAKGMLRITRHPFLWGAALFSAAHLLVRRDAASLLMFGTLILVAILGTVSIDAKRRRAHGVAWRTLIRESAWAKTRWIR